MNTMLRRFAVAVLLAALSVPALAGQTIAYPDTEKTVFTITVPDDWTLTPQGHEDGDEDYFYVESEDTTLAFRLVPGANYEQAMDDHIAYLEEHYTDVKLSDVKEVQINGLDTVLMPAVGTDEDGNRRQLGSGWFMLPGGKQVGELWYDVAIDDKAEEAAAIAVLNSLRAAK